MLFSSLALSALLAVSSVSAHSKPNREARALGDDSYVNAVNDLAKRGLPGVCAYSLGL